MSEKDKALLKRQEELLKQMDSMQKQTAMAYLTGLMDGKMLAGMETIKN